MIIAVYKYLIVGLSEHLEVFFAKAQEKGFMEFISVSGKKQTYVPEELVVIQNALKILRHQPVKKERGDDDLDKQQLFVVAERICALQSELDKLREEERKTEAEISRIEPLGDFSLEDAGFFEKHARRKMQFFCMSASKEFPEELEGHLFYIRTEYDLNYFVSISKETFSCPNMIEIKVDKSIHQLKNHRQFIHEGIRLLEAELKGFSGYFKILHETLFEVMDACSLEGAKRKVLYPLTDAFFAVEAWVPENKVHAMQGIVQGLDIFIERIAINQDEKIPTYIENKGFRKSGEDLVKIYDVPSSKDKDPSGWVLWTFALFFAMIVADAGYGFIYIALAFIAERRMKNALSPFLKRMIKLTKVLGIGCVLWGTLTSCFFGLNINLNNPVIRISALNYLVEKKADYHVRAQDANFNEIQAKHPGSTIEHKHHLLSLGATHPGKKTAIYEEFANNILLELSLLIGVIHICASLIRYASRNYANIGWVLFAIGGYLWFPAKLNAASLIQVLGLTDGPTAHAIGYQLVLVGFSAAILLAVIRQGWSGLKEIMNLVQIFSDILSYLRLYALALASSIMAATFNELCISKLGLVLGGLALIFGHGVNFGLGTMGGFVSTSSSGIITVLKGAESS